MLFSTNERKARFFAILFCCKTEENICFVVFTEYSFSFVASIAVFAGRPIEHVWDFRLFILFLHLVLLFQALKSRVICSGL